MKKDDDNTSWENVSKWYHDLVGDEGHYYHQHVIFPNLLKLLRTKKANLSLLDLGCGQGILSKILSRNFTYDGVDLSPSLLDFAKQHAPSHAHFHLHDLCSPFDLKKTFTHATMILSLQNMEAPLIALQNAKRHLKQGGTLILVLNHPCFRIPRQSSWEIDEQKKLQYRRIDHYMTPMKIPIDMRVKLKKEIVQTFSFHHSLSDIFSYLHSAGFATVQLFEWISDKDSTGKHATMENRSRIEFPLFLTIVAKSL